MVNFRASVLCLVAGCGSLIVASSMAGCDRGPSASGPRVINPSPATQPVAIEPATEPSTQPGVAVDPASTQPAQSIVVINGVQHYFGPAMLRLSRDDKKVVARLYSDDPTEVLTGAEIADSYDFKMILPDTEDPAEIAGAVWTFKSASSDREESPYGIFLNKDHQLLQPMNVEVRFAGKAPNIQVLIRGTFWKYSTTDQIPTPPPVMTPVVASLPARVVSR